jgi:hypothetical protein
VISPTTEFIPHTISTQNSSIVLGNRKNVKLIQISSGEQDKLYEQLLHDYGKKAEVR